ncbi:MAG TPA: hypothetical protein VGP73_29455 [Thermoanaerobaculia bacterium]
MKPTLLLTLLLALTLSAVSFAAQAPPLPAPLATCQTPAGAAPLFLAPEVKTPALAPKALPTDPLKGAIFLGDPDCESACQDQYYQCASGCSACDSCSCQLAYCRVDCGDPFTGC